MLDIIGLLVCLAYLLVVIFGILAGARTPFKPIPSDSTSIASEIQSINSKQRGAMIGIAPILLGCCVIAALMSQMSRSGYINAFNTPSLIIGLVITVLHFALLGYFFYSLALVWVLHRRRQALKRAGANPPVLGQKPP